MTIQERLEDTETALHIAQVDRDKWKARAIKLAEILRIRDCDIDDFDLNNITNGEVITALFPNAKFDNALPFTDGRWEIMNLDTENLVRAAYKPTQLRTYADWWNSPYKRGDGE